MASSSQKIILYPEIAAAALKHRLHNAYVVYAALKSDDRAQNGQGLIKYAQVVDMITRLLGVSKSHAYRVLNTGVNIFWRAPRRGVVGLISHYKSYMSLAPTMFPSKPARVTLQQLGFDSGNYNATRIKDFLVAIVASWDNGGSPQSILSIATLTGISERTIQRHLRYCENSLGGINLVSFASYQTKQDNLNQLVAKQACVALNSRGQIRYRVEWRNGSYAIIYQGPNAYRLDGVERLGRRKRHKHLKSIVTTRQKKQHV